MVRVVKPHKSTMLSKSTSDAFLIARSDLYCDAGIISQELPGEGASEERERDTAQQQTMPASLLL